MAEKSIIKICFIAPKAYPLFNPSIKSVFGGAELDCYLLAKELAKDKNFEVSFIVADYGQKESENCDGITVIKTLDFKQNSLAGAVKLWKGFKKADAQIYFQKTASLGTFLAALFCKFYKTSFIYRTASQKECDGTYLKEHRFTGFLFEWALRKAKLITAQNVNDQKKLSEHLCRNSIMIPNGHPMPEIVSGLNQRDTILWVGRSAKVKRPEYFIDLAEKMPNERFTMICQLATGDQNYNSLKERASKINNLQFVERVTFSEIDKYFQRAKVFVNTSDTEGFPNTFIQACQYAVPILSLNVNPDGFLKKQECGLCAERDFEKLKSYLKELLRPEVGTKYGQNARRYAQENHDIGIIVEVYKRLFREMADLKVTQA